jgi:ribosomal-protein-alanine N-acetyltransferase
LPALVEIEKRVHVSPWSLQAFEGELAKDYSRVWVLTDDETDAIIAGYIVFWELLDNCQVLNLAVDLSFRGCGLAKLLVREAARSGIRKGLRFMNLEVRVSNQPAIQLYQGLGFAILAVRKNFYSNSEDAYQMRLALEEDGVRF